MSTVSSKKFAAFNRVRGLVASSLVVAALALAAIIPAGSASADDATQVSQRSGQQYCVSCYGETNDMTSKRTCYEISVPTQIHMRAFGIRQCTALSGNLWYNFAEGSCKGKRYCNKVIKK